MNNYSLGGRYSKAVLTHFEKFIRTQNLFNKTRPLLLSVSGGIDSMALVDLIVKLRRFGYSNTLRVINFNHNTRKAQDSEGKLVYNFCSLLGIETILVNLEGLDPKNNFESQARKKRYQVIESYLQEGELCLLGQHIDDSYEWHLLQQSKSSNLKSTIGIPVKNNYKVRPLMCLTKNQIKKYVKENSIPYLEDPTNQSCDHERNYLRNKVIPLIRKRHPKYLKHYTYLMTDLSKKLNLLLQKTNISSYESFYDQDYVCFYKCSEEKLKIDKDEIIKAIKFLNPDSRSNLASQIMNIQTSHYDGKLGPHRISGGLKVYADFNTLLIVRNEKNESFEMEFGQNLKLSFTEYKTYLEHYFANVKHDLNFPFIVELNDSSFKKRSINFSYKSKRLVYLKEKNINYYPALKLLREWSKKKNKTKKVNLRFLK